MTTKTEQRGCVNCQYFSTPNTCSAALPSSFSGFLIRRKPVTWEDGKRCLAHKFRAVRKVAAQEAVQP